MLTPEQVVEIVELMQPTVDKLNAWIIQDLVKRIVARMEHYGTASLSETDKWQIQVMQDAGGHIDALQKELVKWTKLADSEVAKIFEDAGIKALAYDSEFYIAHGLQGFNLSQSEGMIRLLQDTFQRTLATIHNFTRTTAEASQKRLIEELDEAHFKVMSGATSYTTAVKEALESICKNQVKVRYPTGHVDTIETAVLRAVRTGVAQAAGNMAIEGMLERDWDIILVSAHLGARYGDGGNNPSNHFWWQGKFYTRTGRTPNLPDFEKSTGYGTGEGLCGWNCRHSFGPGDLRHNPYEQFDAKENKEAYDLSQKQRRLERNVRHTKDDMIAVKAGIDACTDPELKADLQEHYNKMAQLLGKQNRAYNEFCEENGLKRYEDRLQVARWNREQAKDSIVAERAAAAAEQQKPYEDITGRWYPDTKPNSHEVLDMQSVTVDGITYKVDGHNVQLSYSPHEKEIAELLEREVGGEIFMVPKVNSPQGIRTPDYLFNGDACDLKTLEKKAADNTIYNRVKKSHGQANTIIVDISKGQVSDGMLQSQTNKVFWSRETKFVRTLVVVKDGKIIHVFQRRK